MGGGNDPRDTIDAKLRPGEGVLVPEATQMLGGEKGIEAINRMAEQDRNPTWEETQDWTAEDWKRWRKRHPRFEEPTPTATPQNFSGGGVARGGRRGGSPSVGFFGGTDDNPEYWFDPTFARGTGRGGLAPGGFRTAPWGQRGFNPMGSSWTDASLYGRHWLDKMYPGRGYNQSASLADGGVVKHPMEEIVGALKRLGIKI